MPLISVTLTTAGINNNGLPFIAGAGVSFANESAEQHSITKACQIVVKYILEGLRTQI